MSDRIYINADEAKITYKGFCKVDLEMYDGRKFEDLEPRRLFPLSGLTKYITLLSPEMKEVALIRDIGQLMPESRQAVEKCLDEYYMIPKITAILDRKENKQEGSYTCYLFEKGLDKILKKVGEECSETIIAAKNGDNKETVLEISDLIYHLFVMMAQQGITVDEVMEELAKRSQKTGNLKTFHQVDKNT